MKQEKEPLACTGFAFLGPKGTYSEQAAIEFAKALGVENPEYRACRSFDTVFDEIETGRCEYGIVASENSIVGPVTSAYDAFAERSGFRILGELVIDLDHCLLLHPEAAIERVSTVCSHPQALAQCQHFLDSQFPSWTQIPTQSTAEAVRLALQDPALAAIASKHAAEQAGARIAKQGIADHEHDQTSFALVARESHPAVFEDDESTKTSLALFLHNNQPGALLMILSEFAFAGINLSSIQSRPTKRKLGEYMFFVDVEATASKRELQIALDCLRLKLREVKVLGSYPRISG